MDCLIGNSLSYLRPCPPTLLFCVAIRLVRLYKKAMSESRGNEDRKAGFAEFCGVWSQADLAEFEKNTEDMRKADRQDWRGGEGVMRKGR